MLSLLHVPDCQNIAVKSCSIDSDARLSMVQGLVSWLSLLPADQCTQQLSKITAPALARISDAVAQMHDPSTATAGLRALVVQCDILRATAVTLRRTIDKHAILAPTARPQCPVSAIRTSFGAVVSACLTPVRAVVSGAGSADEEAMGSLVAFLEACVLLLQSDIGQALADLLQVVLPLFQARG
jgi:hypothetical protein